MKSIIKEILYGNRGQKENIEISKEYRDILIKISKTYTEIENKLSQEDRNIFKKFCSLEAELEGECAETYFIEGVKLGILLGIEACN